MRSRHPSIGLLCGVLVISGSVGCAVNSSVARRSDADHSNKAVPERLISIARIFESQGRLEQADLTYRRALRRFPSNEQARNGIARIASMNKTRSFRAPGTDLTLPADSPMVAAGNLSAEKLRAAAPEPTLRSVTTAQNAGISHLESRTAESLTADARAALTNSLNPRSINVQTELPPESPGVAHLTVVDSGSTLISATALAIERPEASSSMADWLDAPARHVEALLATLEPINDSERRALAAAVLADAPAGDTRVDSALEQYCTDSDAMVAAAAGDSLLVRGIINDASVQRLLALAEHSNSGVRSQVSSSMRMLVGTSWETDVVRFLTDRLDDSDPAVRSMAALTLGDFDGDSGVILERLVDRYTVETDSGVRNSLELAAERIGTLPVDEQ